MMFWNFSSLFSICTNENMSIDLKFLIIILANFIRQHHMDGLTGVPSVIGVVQIYKFLVCWNFGVRLYPHVEIGKTAKSYMTYEIQKCFACPIGHLN